MINLQPVPIAPLSQQAQVRPPFTAEQESTPVEAQAIQRAAAKDKTEPKNQGKETDVDQG